MQLDMHNLLIDYFKLPAFSKLNVRYENKKVFHGGSLNKAIIFKIEVCLIIYIDLIFLRCAK